MCVNLTSQYCTTWSFGIHFITLLFSEGCADYFIHILLFHTPHLNEAEAISKSANGGAIAFRTFDVAPYISFANDGPKNAGGTVPQRAGASEPTM